LGFAIKKGKTDQYIDTRLFVKQLRKKWLYESTRVLQKTSVKFQILNYSTMLRILLKLYKIVKRSRKSKTLRNWNHFQTIIESDWGSIRIGLQRKRNEIILIRILQRKDIYTYFP
jgi:hypothetical protein